MWCKNCVTIHTQFILSGTMEKPLTMDETMAETAVICVDAQ